jgi:hypothetical protein
MRRNYYREIVIIVSTKKKSTHGIEDARIEEMLK